MIKQALQRIKSNPWLVTIMIIAFGVRFVGLFHDLPYSYYPDEEHFINRAISFGSGDLNPHWFHKPAFLMYLLFFEYGLYFVIGKLLGIFQSVDDFAVSFFQSKGPFIFIGRLTVTLFGVATVYLTYLTGKDYWNKRTGLIAAIFMAIAIGHVVSSQDIKADVPSAFFTMLSFYFIYKIYNGGRIKHYLLSGIFAGLGMATKYYAAPLILTVLLAHMFYLKKENYPVLKNIINKASLCFVMGFLVAFFVASPYNFLDPLGFEDTFLSPLRKLIDLSGEKTESSLRFVGVEVERFVFIKSLGHYFSVLTSAKGMGVIGIISIVGMLILFVKSSMKNIILLSFPVLFIFIANKMNPFYSEPRHMSVIYPFMALFAAYFIDLFYDRFQERKKYFVHAFLILLLIMPAYHVIMHNYLINLTDTRTLAKEWIEMHIPSGTKILINESSVRLSPDEKYYEYLLEKARNIEKSQFTVHSVSYYEYSLKALPEITYDITYIRFPWWQDKEKEEGVYYALSDSDKDMGNPLKPVGVMPYKFYENNGYEYIIVSSEKYRKFLEKDSLTSIKYSSFHEFYKSLFENGLLINEFRPEIMKSQGPVIKIFKVG